ncbi:hypothetical protein MIB92_06500 [Aestuariirhabdus sp. Z084]|uniref:hypothetical protein n=1 Tax=Aestuariirhabdus haliotis TaxID=2918751 RepID=UPI00201B4334|nr:hypothetical protein [Aestuariirhabdus haliotis]MCL6415293.1 hypothetical protein [Aestuariirhabdus haliotis]MCL6419553.1 hypothetical protein [Aestuariirhabdus haliotis]
MRDVVLGLCILGSMVLGYFFAMDDHQQWMHWPIYISLLSLAALVATPLKWRSSNDDSAVQTQFDFVSRWTDRIPEPVKKSFSIFLAIVLGGVLAALATKLGVPLPTGE